MDLMKVLDQTVREIKREVNLKVLKVPEIEQKVLDATNNEPWGPHGSALAEISQATKKFTECQMIMNALWTRLTDTGPNWRHVYKALAVIEYLVANGSERAVDDILERSFRISSLSGFEYVEPNGKDVGINVRKKVETILALLNDKEKIQAVRNKASANRDKYFGLSSTGITYKSGSTSYRGSSFQHNDGYGGLGGAKEVETFKSGYKDRDQNGDETDWKRDRRDVHDQSQENTSVNERTTVKKGITRQRRDAVQSNETKSLANHDPLPPPNCSNAQSKANDNDFDDFDPRGCSTSEFDDFDPRGSSTSESAATSFKQVNLFDLMDAPTSSAETVSNTGSVHDVDLFADATFVSAPHAETSTVSSMQVRSVVQQKPISSAETVSNTGSAHEVDLFADATFVSAPHAETSTGSSIQAQIDLFADQPTAPASFPNVDPLSKPDSGISIETKSPMSTDTSTFDPFAAIPLNTPESSDLFGTFTSHSDSASIEPSQTPGNDSLGNLNQSTSKSSKPAPTKGTFQVKSGIWADSLSRGLIDLNLTAPKKVSLSDVGIVGGLTDGSDEKEKRPPASTYMGRAMVTVSGLGKPGFPSSPAAGWK